VGEKTNVSDGGEKLFTRAGGLRSWRRAGGGKRSRPTMGLAVNSHRSRKKEGFEKSKTDPLWVGVLGPDFRKEKPRRFSCKGSRLV